MVRAEGSLPNRFGRQDRFTQVLAPAHPEPSSSGVPCILLLYSRSSEQDKIGSDGDCPPTPVRRICARTRRCASWASCPRPSSPRQACLRTHQERPAYSVHPSGSLPGHPPFRATGTTRRQVGMPQPVPGAESCFRLRWPVSTGEAARQHTQLEDRKRMKAGWAPRRKVDSDSGSGC